MSASIVIAGVGGQGSLLASRLLGAVLQEDGLELKVSEVHGMSQRGGSVVTYVKFGARGTVHAPVVCDGEADVLLAFEQLEALRWLSCLKPQGRVISDLRTIPPLSVLSGAPYPQDIPEQICAHQGSDFVTFLDATALAITAGHPRASNVVLLGALARELHLPRENWERAIHRIVKPDYVALNCKAFALGYEAI